jgi:Ni,Fe-hydrogenase I large subunit
MVTRELNISPVGRVEGDLDVNVYLENGVVTRAHTQASMFRGFEKILQGKDPHAGLLVTLRVCGICGGSHLYCASSALDTIWKTMQKVFCELFNPFLHPKLNLLNCG